jgi:serine/threonine-protein kinase RsbW
VAYKKGKQSELKENQPIVETFCTEIVVPAGLRAVFILTGTSDAEKIPADELSCNGLLTCLMEPCDPVPEVRMLSPLQESCWSTALKDSLFSEPWCLAYLSSVDEIVPQLDEVAQVMTTVGYSQKDVFCVRLALEEALVNAIKHGHRHDPRKQVEFRYRIDREKVLLEVEDQGQGFDPQDIPDPTAVENLERPCGRGLLLMRAYMTWIRYNESGNCLTLCKRPGKDSAGRRASST